ncbi:hypothetical protein R52603_02938 [Paraburkholderia saeva]|uniref:Uncharacterized protein n=1 Tax=Paraburkholderia saeva TaxID=2777537 RepID=A0A9N8RSJ4_9BURK|nr:hypothetical protein LMG31841_00222 [Paraburkholderia saeva]CAG4887117.1 hypothetical protein R70241_00338 [Paraburkholderia saeva]CAG4902167.1 hypothetical protein R52603_02938 [Paraburkholderia saeva]
MPSGASGRAHSGQSRTSGATEGANCGATRRRRTEAARTAGSFNKTRGDFQHGPGQGRMTGLEDGQRVAGQSIPQDWLAHGRVSPARRPLPTYCASMDRWRAVAVPERLRAPGHRPHMSRRPPVRWVPGHDFSVGDRDRSMVPPVHDPGFVQPQNRELEGRMAAETAGLEREQSERPLAPLKRRSR